MKLSDTPRTDAMSWHETTYDKAEVVGARFARQLERELSTQDERIKELEAQVAKLKYDAEMLDVTKSELQSDLDDKIAQQRATIIELHNDVAQLLERTK